jgi:hypothetical protein
LRAGARRRLVAPVRSLAVHGNTDVGGFPAPGDGSLGGRGEVSWCGLVACLRNAARAVRHGPPSIMRGASLRPPSDPPMITTVPKVPLA